MRNGDNEQDRRERRSIRRIRFIDKKRRNIVERQAFKTAGNNSNFYNNGYYRIDGKERKIE